ncbi:MAG: hypothetical protein HYY40_01365 [Bacteroidetes bacterium]|nr:hypothetical protein [Bacteroidota bacterium]
MFKNYSHTVEEFDGVKCSVVEKDIPAGKVDFLKALLEANGYKVLIKKTEVKPVKPATPQVTVTATATATEIPPSPQLPQTFTLGVTDITFNLIMEVYEKNLKAPEGRVISPHFWETGRHLHEDFYWSRNG